jgi:hypothetical protein
LHISIALRGNFAVHLLMTASDFEDLQRFPCAVLQIIRIVPCELITGHAHPFENLGKLFDQMFQVGQNAEMDPSFLCMG